MTSTLPDQETVWSLLDTFKAELGDEQVDEDEAEANELHCNHCGHTDIHLEDGNYICQKCHSVVDRFIDSGAEWRYYGPDDHKQSDPTRCGMPTNDLLPISTLGSQISARYGEGFSMKIIRRQHFWNSVDYKERTLYHIFEDLTAVAVNNGISPSIIDDAKRLYKQMVDTKVRRGANKQGMIATSIYISCKNHGVARSAKEIASIFNLNNTCMTKACKRFQDIVNITVDSSNPDDFINRFGSKINITPDMKEICAVILQKADEKGILCENTPPSIAASVLYMSSVISNQESPNEKKADVVAKACGISGPTVMKCFKRLWVHRGELLTHELIVKHCVV